MKFFLRFILIASLCAFCAYGTGIVYYALTDGFSIGNITSHYRDEPRWQVHTLTSEENQEVDKALQQNYHYLAKGHQAYVFISEDGNYVIKFPKFHRNRIKPWLKYLPLPAAFEPYRQGRIDFKNARMDAVLESWKTAFDELQEENGLLLVHINSTSGLYPLLQIEDKIGFKHDLNLDKMTFLIQKKAQLVCPTIDETMARHDLNAAKKQIDALVDLFRGEYRRGLAETDNRMVRNTGFINGKAMHIDLGRFVVDDRFKDEKVQHTEILKKTSELRDWLAEHYPALATYLDKALIP
jgi:hypothetical protein